MFIIHNVVSTNDKEYSLQDYHLHNASQLQLYSDKERFEIGSYEQFSALPLQDMTSGGGKVSSFVMETSHHMTILVQLQHHSMWGQQHLHVGQQMKLEGGKINLARSNHQCIHNLHYTTVLIKL